MATPSRLVGGRLDLALLCNDRHYKIAAEIGTDQGLFARDFLDRWHGDRLYCVDNYAPYWEMPWDRSVDREQALSRLLPHARRFRMLHMDSKKAAEWIEMRGTRLDFLYIDAAHDYQSVRWDLIQWYPLVRSGGLIAGDDYGSPHRGVIQAVDEFFKDANIELTTDYNRSPSWFVEKP